MKRKLPVYFAFCFKTLFFIAVFVGLLSACSNEQSVTLGPQQWQELSFRVETRPTPMRVGMNEFIVLANREHKPGVGLVVMLRMGDSGEWRQAIQDGYTGVYRRAMRVDDPATQSLSVHVRRAKSDDKDDETVLLFPLNQKRGVQ
ncbi:MAG: hypothetical protein L3J84_01655 [Gammaproteobacteria bacterium]|nr:hypothetical protein [Gammaproteobacteria bacterium]